jgi:hypothetical protein
LERSGRDAIAPSKAKIVVDGARPVDDAAVNKNFPARRQAQAENFCLLAALHGNEKLSSSTAHATWSLEIRFNFDEAAIGCAWS